MPMTMVKQQLKHGRAYVRTYSSGEVTGADAEQLTEMMKPGSELSNLPILAVVEKGTDYSSEARQAFSRMGQSSPDAAHMPIAVVVQSAPMRVMLSFIIRMTRNASHTRFFGSEGDALAWLEEAVAKKS